MCVRLSPPSGRACKTPALPLAAGAGHDKAPGGCRGLDGAARGACTRATPGSWRPSALCLRTVAVAVRQGIPAFQPVSGAHIRDGACALGPCPWEVPMQSPKPKAARRFPVPYGFRRYHYNTFKWDIVGHLWRGQQCPYLPDREIRHRRGADGVPACSYSTSPQRSVPTFGPAGIYVAGSRGRGRW